MRKYYSFILCFGLICGAHAATDLNTAINNVRANCAGISSELVDMKKMAGINTAVTAVGTVAGGVALGTGLAKVRVDKEAEELEAEIAKLRQMAETQDIRELAVIDVDAFPVVTSAESAETDIASGTSSSEIDEKQQELEKLNKQSKTLGNVRTGTMATAAVSNIVGAVVAGGNQVKGDLKEQINACLVAVKELSNSRMQARLSGASDTELKRAEEIVRACEEWSTVDLSSINTKASGAAISSGIGATLGLAGTVTSAMANTDKVRDDNSDAGKEKEKNLNTASNVLAGGTTVASGVATIFNATQISAIKRAAKVADQCEEALR